MKILLIEPPFNRLYHSQHTVNRYPLSLGYLAGVVKEKTDYDVDVYNADFNPDSSRITYKYYVNESFANYKANLKDRTCELWMNVTEIIRKYQSDIVGISSKSQNYASACITADIAKEVNNQICVIVGGPRPTLIRKEVLNHKSFDIAVIGEGEDTFIELLNAIDKKKDLNDVNGIIYRNDGEIQETPSRAYIRDLDVLPSPYKSANRVLIDYDKYPSHAFRSVFATPGCPFIVHSVGQKQFGQIK